MEYEVRIVSRKEVAPKLVGKDDNLDSLILKASKELRDSDEVVGIYISKCLED